MNVQQNNQQRIMNQTIDMHANKGSFGNTQIDRLISDGNDLNFENQIQLQANKNSDQFDRKQSTSKPRINQISHNRQQSQSQLQKQKSPPPNHKSNNQPQNIKKTETDNSKVKRVSQQKSPQNQDLAAVINSKNHIKGQNSKDQSKEGVVKIHQRNYSEAFNPNRPHVQSTNPPHTGVVQSETSIGILKSQVSSLQPDHYNQQQIYQQDHDFNQFTLSQQQVFNAKNYEDLNENISDSDQEEGSNYLENKNQTIKFQDNQEQMGQVNPVQRPVQFSLKQMHKMAAYVMSDDILDLELQKVSQQQIEKQAYKVQKRNKRFITRSSDNLPTQQQLPLTINFENINLQSFPFETPSKLQQKIQPPIPHHKERNSSPASIKYTVQEQNSNFKITKRLASPPSKLSSQNLIPLKNFQKSYDSNDSEEFERAKDSPTKIQMFEMSNRSYFDVDSSLMTYKGHSPAAQQYIDQLKYGNSPSKHKLQTSRVGPQGMYVSPEKVKQLQEKVQFNVIENSEYSKKKQRKMSPAKCELLSRKHSQPKLNQPRNDLTPDQSAKKMGKQIETSISKMNEKLIVQKTFRQINQVLSYFVKNSYSKVQVQGGKRELNLQQLYDAFYYLGTFQFKYQPSRIQQLRQVTESNFLIQLWNYLFSFQEIYQQPPEDNSMALVDMEIFRSILEILYLTKDKKSCISQLSDTLTFVQQKSSPDQSTYIDLLELTDLVDQFEKLNMNQLGKIHLFRLEKDILFQNSQVQKEFDSQMQERECKFSPQINPNSKLIDSQRPQILQTLGKSKSEQKLGNGNKHLKRIEILYQYNKIAQDKVNQKKLIKDHQEMEGVTFKPQISEKSKELAQKSMNKMSFQNMNSFNKTQIIKIGDMKQYTPLLNRATGQIQQHSNKQQSQIQKQLHRLNEDLDKDYLLDNLENPDLMFGNYQQQIDYLNEDLIDGDTNNHHNPFQKSNPNQDQLDKQSNQHQNQNQDTFILRIQLSNNNEYYCNIHINSDPNELALEFCQENNIDQSLLLEIRNLIKDSIHKFVSSAVDV
eukprot:403353065